MHRANAMQADSNPSTNGTLRPPSPRAPFGIWLAGLVSRSLFIVILVVATGRVASPQIETFRSAYETPGDLIRMAIGLALCLWLVVHLFILPKDAEGYRTWVYLSPLVPLAFLFTFEIW